MKHVTIVSHSKFAPGLYSAIKMMVGGRDDILGISLKADMSVDESVANLRALVESLSADDNAILLMGILSGSPFIDALAVLDEKGLMPNTLVSTGMNAPLAITAVLMKGNFDDAELLKETLPSEGHTGLTEFKVEGDDAENNI